MANGVRKNNAGKQRRSGIIWSPLSKLLRTLQSLLLQDALSLDLSQSARRDGMAFCLGLNERVYP